MHRQLQHTYTCTQTYTQCCRKHHIPWLCRQVPSDTGTYSNVATWAIDASKATHRIQIEPDKSHKHGHIEWQILATLKVSDCVKGKRLRTWRAVLAMSYRVDGARFAHSLHLSLSLSLYLSISLSLYLSLWKSTSTRVAQNLELRTSSVGCENRRTGSMWHISL